MKPLIYDLEIINAVPMKNEQRREGIKYCDGWDDHKNMGISTICAYDYQEQRYRVFCKDNFDAFATLAQERSPLVSFNGIGFDNKVLGETLAILIPDSQCYDILAEIWDAVGIGRIFKYPTHVGFSLDKMGRANLGQGKTGTGEGAPVDWQNGRIGNVIDYCLNDILVTKRIYDRIRQVGYLIDPRDQTRLIKMRNPVVP